MNNLWNVYESCASISLAWRLYCYASRLHRYKNIPAYNPTTTKTAKEVRKLEKR